ncbi:MAG: alpha-amylase [Anaerolineae bacterium]|nr:alpha-amylase [Anaerolineae bacterium]
MPKNNVRFELFAPYNPSVNLVGSWNNWQPIPLKQDDDGCWRVDVPLDDGEYEYQYEVVSKSYFADGQTLCIPDPKAYRLTRSTPERACIIVRTGQSVATAYQWKHDDVSLPPNNQLVIYEMHIGDFYAGPGRDRNWGCFADVLDKLDYLADLGINAIELMPVNEFPDQDHWGYSQHSLYAVENSYGTADELCRLVDECHARGIRVIYDAVYNHMESEAPLTQIDYTYWFYKDNPDDQDLQFGPKFNFEQFDNKLNTYPARDYVIGAMEFWVDTFHLDGIRFDAARALKDFDLMRAFNDRVHQKITFKPFITIAEYIPENPAVTGPNGPLDAAWHENLSKQLQCTIPGIPKDGKEPFNTGEVLRVLDGRNDGYASGYNVVNYIDNHDQDRIMWQVGHYGNLFDEPAFRRIKMGASLLLTAMGMPMLWMGQEFGVSYPRDPMKRQPLDWSYLHNERNADLYRFYQRLINLRKCTPALNADTFEPIADMGDRGVIAYKRWNDAGSIVLVVVNLKPQYAGEFTIVHPGLVDGTWHEANFDYDVTIQDHTLRDTLAESEAKIYVLRES